ncbi:MAG: 50S ribosomal protein L32, partial [Candidatus Omnitrophota bacterium]|jgi:large subunit ribosomal protein L32
MPNPKKRHSNERTRTRRAHDFLTFPGVTKCKQCGAPVLTHRVCAKCGWYKGRQVITPKIKEKKAE